MRIIKKMKVRIAINGYGRIGRAILRSIYENNWNNDIEIIAINSSADINTAVMLTKYDSVHGKFNFNIKVIDKNFIEINGDKIRYLSCKDPLDLPWKELDIDVVNECTGKFRSKEKAFMHIKAGAKKVLISAPGSDIERTIVFGVNEKDIKKNDIIISNSSCTTNCLAPLIKPLIKTIGINKGFLITTHAFTSDQTLIDNSHKDIRRARAAGHSIIPTKTGAASSIGLIIPEMTGKLDGYALRVPTMNVSLVDLTFQSNRKTTIKEINDILYAATENNLKGILAYSNELLVSCDYNHTTESSIYDSTLTKIIDGDFIKISSWYDNEWGFSNRMIDVSIYMMKI